MLTNTFTNASLKPMRLDQRPGFRQKGRMAMAQNELGAWAQSARSDEVLFAEVYRETATKIYGYCYRRLGSPSDAEDAAAEVYLVAWRRRRDLFATETVLAWLYAVASRVVANQLRGRWRAYRLFGRVMSRSSHETVADIASSVAASVDAQLDVRFVLERLTTTDREILRLRYWEELTTAEIARVVGLREGTVRTRIFRVRRSLAANSQFPTKGKEA